MSDLRTLVARALESWEKSPLRSHDGRLYDDMDALRAALAAEQPQPVASGWRLVPVEPTEAMLRAIPSYERNSAVGIAVYRAMLAAAPAEQPQPVEGLHEYALRLLVAAGHVEQSQADEAVNIARRYVPPPPAAEPITQDAILDEFCRTPGLRQHVQAFEAGVRYAERVLAAAAKARAG